MSASDATHEVAMNGGKGLEDKERKMEQVNGKHTTGDASLEGGVVENGSAVENGSVVVENGSVGENWSGVDNGSVGENGSGVENGTGNSETAEKAASENGPRVSEAKTEEEELPENEGNDVSEPAPEARTSEESKNDTAEDNGTNDEVDDPLTAARKEIESLKQERDQALKLNADLLQQMSPNPDGENGGSNTDNVAASEAMLVELQSTLQEQMSSRAEAEEKARQLEVKVKDYEGQLEKFSSMEDEMEKINASLVAMMADKATLETEVSRLREARDDFEQKQIVLSNRLNEARKIEAAKAQLASRMEKENEALQNELKKTKEDLGEMTSSKEKLDVNVEKLKKKCVERVKQSEGALTDERNLNEERKRKMKVFVETKAEELRVAKAQVEELETELEETRTGLRETREKLEQVHAEWTTVQTRNRELQRDMNRMKKNSDHLHRIGDNLELELHRTAQETEEHKNKRLTAKHELMTILRTLEGERAVSGKLRDSIKYTFTPKAISQQQLLEESLQGFEHQLANLSRRLGVPVPPQSSNGNVSAEETPDSPSPAGVEGSPSASGGRKGNARGNKAEVDSTRLLSNLEKETQKVSQGIMELSSSLERLRHMLSGAGDRTCVSALNDFLIAASAQVNGDVGAGGGGHHHHPSHGGDDHGEDGVFAGTGGGGGTAVSGSLGVSHGGGRRESSERHGLVGSATGTRSLR